MRLIEVVPNVSEGRSSAVVTQLASAIAGRGAHVLSLSSDPSHHRTVLTAAGDPAVVHDAMLALVGTAMRLIDIMQHEGVHPRLGAVDVIPFVPLTDASMDDAVVLTRRLATEIAAAFDIPVFLYEAAATAPHRQRLDQIRAGGIQSLAVRMRQPEWKPDAGPDTPHPTAGVIAIGARPPLVAFNVNLVSDDIRIARQIAGRVRTRDGGPPGIKALALRLAHRGLVQVSMNLTDLNRTSIADAWDTVAQTATACGVGILESEIVGLVPAASLGGRSPHDLRIRNWSEALVLETQLHRVGLLPRA